MAMRTSSRCVALGMFLVSSLPESSMSAPASWFSYSAYPSARQLCHEHVRASGPRRMEIEWMLFASADAPEEVIAFYERDEKSRAKRDEHGGYDIASKSAARDRMSIIPAAKASHYPHCATRATANEKTVILVSRAVGG
jgi:hypothetical protein